MISAFSKFTQKSVKRQGIKFGIISRASFGLTTILLEFFRKICAQSGQLVKYVLQGQGNDREKSENIVFFQVSGNPVERQSKNNSKGNGSRVSPPDLDLVCCFCVFYTKPLASSCVYVASYTPCLYCYTFL